MSENTFSFTSRENTGAQDYSDTVEAAVLDVCSGDGNAHQKQENYNFAEAALAAVMGREDADRKEIASAEQELAEDYRKLAKAMSDPKKSGGVIAVIKRQITIARARVTSGFARLRHDTSLLTQIQEDVAPTRGNQEVSFNAD